MKRFRIIENGLCIELYRPVVPNRDERLAVYFYGFPGSSGKTEPVVKLVDAGYTVIQPHYRGTYDSTGEFSPSTAMGTLREIADIIQKGVLVEIKNGSKVHIPTKIDFVVGHSFGCFPALKGSIDVNGVKKILLMGPQISFNQDGDGVGSTEDGNMHFYYVKNSRPHTYRLGAWASGWEQLYDAKLDGVSGVAPVTLDKVMVVIGENDKYFNVDLVRQNSQQIVHKSLLGDYTVNINVVKDVGHGPKGLFNNETMKFILGS
jgi:esterase/lipase